MEEIEKIIINKNRGWRGLAEVQCLDIDNNIITRMIFSFSEQVWKDMLKGFIVLQDKDNYYVLEFDNKEDLPKPTQQRSVLIKGFMANVIGYWKYSKTNWTKPSVEAHHYDYIYNFMKNSNNHTTSDWNCIGIRVVPII